MRHLISKEILDSLETWAWDTSINQVAHQRLAIIQLLKAIANGDYLYKNYIKDNIQEQINKLSPITDWNIIDNTTRYRLECIVDALDFELDDA